MRDKLGINDVRKYIFMTDERYLLHLGEHFEHKILQAKNNMEPVVRIISVNGNPSAIPLERALFLLEKYYKITKKTPANVKENKVVALKQQTDKELVEMEEAVMDDHKKMA